MRLHTSNYPWKAFKLSLIIHSFINSKSFFKMSLWGCKIEQFSLTSHPSVSLKGKSDVKRKGKIRLSSSWCIYTIKVKPLAQQAQNSFSSPHHKPKVFHLFFYLLYFSTTMTQKKEEVEEKFQQALEEEEQRIIYQRKLLLLNTKKVREKEIETIIRMKNASLRNSVEAREKDLEAILRTIEKQVSFHFTFRWLFCCCECARHTPKIHITKQRW